LACDWATLCIEFHHCHHHYHRRLAAKKFGKIGGTSTTEEFFADEPAVNMTVRFGEIQPQPPTKQLYSKPHSMSFLRVTFPDFILTIVASPRPSSSRAVDDSAGDVERMMQYVRFVTSGGIPGGRSSPLQGSQEKV
jgi:hypothetical protein